MHGRGPLNCNYDKEPQNSVGNYLGPNIRPSTFEAQKLTGRSERGIDPNRKPAPRARAQLFKGLSKGLGFWGLGFRIEQTKDP